MLLRIKSKFQTAKKLAWIDFGRETAKRIRAELLWDCFSYFYFKTLVFFYERSISVGNINISEGNSSKKLYGPFGHLKIIPEKTIFAYWHQGIEEAPEVVRVCRSQIKLIAAKQGLQVIELDHRSLKNYIDVPDAIESRLHQGSINLAHYSDYIRTKLLLTYGGFWIDSTLFFTDEIPKYIFEQNLFTFKFQRKTFQHSSNQFIFSKFKNNIQLKKMVSFLEYYWARVDQPDSYFFYHYCFAVFAAQLVSSNVSYPAKHWSEDNHVCYIDFLSADWTAVRFLNFSRSFVHKLSYKDKNVERHAVLMQLLQNYVNKHFK